jgi:hypothetical protein
MRRRQTVHVTAGGLGTATKEKPPHSASLSISPIFLDVICDGGLLLRTNML